MRHPRTLCTAESSEICGAVEGEGSRDLFFEDGEWRREGEYTPRDTPRSVDPSDDVIYDDGYAPPARAGYEAEIAAYRNDDAGYRSFDDETDDVRGATAAVRRASLETFHGDDGEQGSEGSSRGGFTERSSAPSTGSTERVTTGGA